MLDGCWMDVGCLLHCTTAWIAAACSLPIHPLPLLPPSSLGRATVPVVLPPVAWPRLLVTVQAAVPVGAQRLPRRDRPKQCFGFFLFVLVVEHIRPQSVFHIQSIYGAGWKKSSSGRERVGFTGTKSLGGGWIYWAQRKYDHIKIWADMLLSGS